MNHLYDSELPRDVSDRFKMIVQEIEKANADVTVAFRADWRDLHAGRRMRAAQNRMQYALQRMHDYTRSGSASEAEKMCANEIDTNTYGLQYSVGDWDNEWSVGLMEEGMTPKELHTAFDVRRGGDRASREAAQTLRHVVSQHREEFESAMQELANEMDILHNLPKKPSKIEALMAAHVLKDTADELEYKIDVRMPATARREKRQPTDIV